MPALTHEEIIRYSRHLRLPGFGTEGQQKLKKSAALIVGIGGLGSPIALYLAASGVGKLGLVDFDIVELNNLHRQIVHSSKDLGRLKIDSAREKIHAMNPEIELKIYEKRFSSENAFRILEEYDLVIDGSDNFPTRYLVNDACILSRKKYIYGSVYQFEGQVSVFGAPSGPCYRCLFPEPPPPDEVPNCAEGGILGVLPGVIGTLQSLEAIKALTGIGIPLIGRLLHFDARQIMFQEIKIKKNHECRICGANPSIRQLPED